MTADGPLVRPGDHLSRGVRAKPVGLRSDSNATQVQPIGVPAGEEGRVSRRDPVGVQTTRVEQQLETAIVEMNERSM
jgi:hypothetical protein